MSDELTRDDLERELVTMDRQKVITQCLKLFNANRELIINLVQSRKVAIDEQEKGKVLKAENKLTKEVNERLVNMSVWKFRIHRIKGWISARKEAKK